MRRKAPGRTSRRKTAGKNMTDALKLSAVAYLAIILFPWNRVIGFDTSALRADAAGKANTIAIASVPSVAAGLPLRLKIPSVNINAAIEHVALKKDGSMDTPKLPRNAAWYELGPKPGEIGSAVIAGHVNWWNGAVSAFANLSKVKVGDKMTVQDDGGALIHFTVRKVRRMDVAADATAVFVSTDGKAHLNLVTCIGVWNKKTRQYSQRLIIFADKDQ